MKRCCPGEARPGALDPRGARRRPLAHARPRDARHSRPVPRLDRGHGLHVAERVPAVALGGAARDRRALRRARRRAARGVLRHRRGTTRASGKVSVRRSSARSQSIALNYAPSDPAADGLTHGMWLVLRETLEGTPYADRLVSSAQVVGSLGAGRPRSRSNASAPRSPRRRRSSRSSESSSGPA